MFKICQEIRWIFRNGLFNRPLPIGIQLARAYAEFVQAGFFQIFGIIQIIQKSFNPVGIPAIEFIF